MHPGKKYPLIIIFRDSWPPCEKGCWDGWYVFNVVYRYIVFTEIFLFVRVCVMNLMAEERESFGKKERSGAGHKGYFLYVQQGDIYPQRE